MDQDLLLELLQLRSRLETELVGQQVPDPLVRGQRVGLATARYSAVISSTHRLSWNG